MSEERLQRWTDVDLKRVGGKETTAGGFYRGVLVREGGGLLKFILTRPARVTVPGGIQCAN